MVTTYHFGSFFSAQYNLSSFFHDFGFLEQDRSMVQQRLDILMHGPQHTLAYKERDKKIT
jgi:hypothetical protein